MTLAAVPDSGRTVHPVIQTWIEQLLDPDIANLVLGREGQIELRLYANGGKVRKVPMVLLNSLTDVRMD